MPITRALVGLHDGELIIESARGVGTLIMVKFPASRVKFVGEQELGFSLARAGIR